MDTLITNVTAVTMAPGTEVLFGVNIGITDGKIEFISKKALGSNLKDAHLRDDLVHAMRSSQRQTALLQDLGIALGSVLHADNAMLGADAQVHSAAHASSHHQEAQR